MGISRVWDINHKVTYKYYMGGSINGGTPIAGWFLSWKTPSRSMDDDWGYLYDSGNPHMDYSLWQTNIKI